jgi:RNA polymerase sigma-70 factor (ECF subfamily)
MDGAVFSGREPCAASASQPFETFFRAHYDFVWRNLRRLGVPGPQVDDALQDVFVTAHRKRDQLHEDASERAWLFTILRRVAFRYRRSESRHQRKIDALGHMAPTEHIDRTQEGVDARRFLGSFLAGLGDKRRPVFVMIELEGMTAPEVAGALDLKLNTVYSRLRLGRAAFDREVGKLHARERAHERVIARADRTDNPPAGAAAAAWLLFEPRLATPGAAASGGWAIWSQVGIFATTVVAGTAFLLAATTHAPRPEPSPQTSAPVQTAIAVGPRARSEAVRPPPERMTPPPAPVVEIQSPKASARRPASTVSSQMTSPEGDGIDAEARLLKRARTALADGDPQAALEFLDRHATRFASSSLADLRDAIRVSALCEAGKTRQARAEARLFVRRHPGSRLGEGIRGSCDGR